MVFQPQNWHQCTSKNNGFELELSILGFPNEGLWATVFNIFQYHSDPQNVEKSFICPSQRWGLGMGFILTPLRPPPLWVGRWSHRHLEPRFECHLPRVSRRRCWNSLNLHNSKLFENCSKNVDLWNQKKTCPASTFNYTRHLGSHLASARMHRWPLHVGTKHCLAEPVIGCGAPVSSLSLSCWL